MENLKRSNRINKEELLVDETIFSIANGFLGTRGTFAEGYGTVYEYNQSYLNGFYDYYDYHYEENLSGFPQKGQKFVNLINGQRMEFIVNDVPLNLSNCQVIKLDRVYDLQSGVTLRTIHYKTANNYEFILKESKLASYEHKELIAIKMELKSLNYDGNIHVKSYLQEAVKKEIKKNDPRINESDIKHLDIISVSTKDHLIISKTSRSNLYLASSILHDKEFTYEDYNNKIVGKKAIEVKANDEISITKYIIHTSSLYHEDYLAKNKELYNLLNSVSFDDLLLEQKAYYQTFWESSYIKVDGDNDMESLLNYNLFQLNCSGAESEIHNIPAKGLSGEGYEGHTFWDTEIYMIPYFTLTNPLKARNLLMYRYNTLERARVEARNLGYEKGVKIPWRTINGDETSPYYPAGSAQFHINSDVAYSIIKYYQATNDFEFMISYGFEMLLETARFLVEAVNYSNGYYHLNGVTGPDEYTTVVNDNYYTNQLLKYHFSYISEFYFNNLKSLKELTKRLDLTQDEISHIKDIAENIYVEFNKELNIYSQDSSFLTKEKLDLGKIPSNKFPLLLNFHPLYLYKHQVLKQADTLLSMVLLDFEDEDIFKDSFNYYEPITTHDSSLSKCIHSIVAFKLNKFDLACKYLESVLETDYYNTHKNTEHGLHVANLGGSYLGFIMGVLGLRIHSQYLKVNPKVTKRIRGYELNIMYQGSKVKFKVTDKLTISTDKEINMMIYGTKVLIKDFYQTDLQ